MSNWSAETFRGMTDEYPFLNKFDGLIISGEYKIIKPNYQIYELAIKKFNLKPDKCVFVDDNLQNVKAAKDLGFKTIHLINPLKIKESIDKFINQLGSSLKEKNISIALSEDVKDYLVKNGYSQTYGARPLTRLIQLKIKEPIADYLLSSKLKTKILIKIDLEKNNNKLKFNFITEKKKEKII